MIGKRIVGPRWCVIPGDDAVDWRASDLDGYRDALFDVEQGHLVILDGKTPTEWQIKPLTVRQKRFAAGIGKVGERFRDEAIVRCGLLNVRGYVLVSEESGSEKSLPKMDRKQRGDYGECLSDDWIEKADLNEEVIRELAKFIWEISEARPLSCSK